MAAYSGSRSNELPKSFSDILDPGGRENPKTQSFRGNVLLATGDGSCWSLWPDALYFRYLCGSQIHKLKVI